MVLDAGNIVSHTLSYILFYLILSGQVEFDSPQELLKDEDGVFRGLVDESGVKDTLHAMVTEKNSTLSTL